MRKNELNQRSGFQFEIFKLNLFSNAGLIVFALAHSPEWKCALLACPFISLTLFSLWFHHSIVIKINDGIDQSNSGPEPKGSKMDQMLRVSSFAISMITNFTVIPAVAMFLYLFRNQARTQEWLKVLAWICLALVLLFFSYWFWLQYLKSKDKKGT